MKVALNKDQYRIGTTMQDPTLSFEGNTVRIDDQKWDVDYSIQECTMVDDKVVLIYDYSAKPSYSGQFRNLEAFDITGRKLWTAEHPTNETADVYVHFINTHPLTAWNFACYVCRIDPSNGKLLEAAFTK
jgi:hypothetical protein